MVRRTEIYVAV